MIQAFQTFFECISASFIMLHISNVQCQTMLSQGSIRMNVTLRGNVDFSTGNKEQMLFLPLFFFPHSPSLLTRRDGLLARNHYKTSRCHQCNTCDYKHAFLQMVHDFFSPVGFLTAV